MPAVAISSAVSAMAVQNLGAGHTMFSMVNGMISSIIVRVPAAYFFGMHECMGMCGIGIGAPVASAASLLCVSGAWKKEVINEKFF